MSRGEERRMLRVKRKVAKRGVDSITFQVANHDEMVWAVANRVSKGNKTVAQLIADGYTAPPRKPV
jgi:hypothetical protein